MELKLEDYAKRENRMWYEIMREHAEGAHAERGPGIFLRPSSGSLEVLHFIKQDNGIFLLLSEKNRPLRGVECYINAVFWCDMAVNEPPWVIPRTSSTSGDLKNLPLIPLFVYSEYLPNDETENYMFGIPNPITITLSNVWIRKKQIESTSSITPKGKRCILWKGVPHNLEKLANLLTNYGYIDVPSVWSAHFSTDILKRTIAPPIKWEKNKYELKYLLKNLQIYEIFEPHSSHSEGLKGPPWIGEKPTEKLDTIKAILKHVN